MTRKEKIRSMLDGLSETLDKFLAIPDEMKESLDPRDIESIRRTSSDMIEFNESLDSFIELADKLANRVKSFYSIDPEVDDIETSLNDPSDNNRIIKTLDDEKPHSITENFTFKRPHGFILKGHAVIGLKNWKILFYHVLVHLHKFNAERYSTICDAEEFITVHGNVYFSKSPDQFRSPLQIPGGLYAEANRSAKDLTRVVRDVLKYFSYDMEDIKVYLREDRNATSDDDGLRD